MSFEEEKLEEDRGGRIEGAFTLKYVYSLSLYVFLSFYGFNSLSRDVLVYFLRVKM